MLTPAEYVDAQLAGPERPATLTHAQATAAVQQALSDAARYKDNLLGALRRMGTPAQHLYLAQAEPAPAALGPTPQCFHREEDGGCQFCSKEVHFHGVRNGQPIYTIGDEESSF